MSLKWLPIVICFVASLNGCRTSQSAADTDIKGMNGKGGFDDGCYGIVKSGTDGGAVCVSGLHDEGIGGAGATVAFLDTVGQVTRCLTTTEIAVSGSKTTLKVTVNGANSRLVFDGAEKGTLDLGGKDPWTYALISGRPELLKRAVQKCSGNGGGASASQKGGSPAQTVSCHLPGATQLAQCGTKIDCAIPGVAADETPSYCADESTAWNYQTSCSTPKVLKGKGCGKIVACVMCGDE